ncbi:neurogenic locus notch-like protein [Fagus crenata]
MASSKLMAFIAMLVVLLSMLALGSSDTSPLDGFLEKVCEEVECGKGNCTVDTSYPLGFKCECESGWKRDDDDDSDLSFLPCVIPNCTLKYSGCQPAPPPVPERENPRNISAFDPCYWAYCGEGKCVKNRTYTHQCQCNSGYYNLLNISVFPCYSECTLGSDCASLGIKVSNSTSSGDGSGTGQATSFLPGKFHWIAILMVSFGLVLWK